MLDLIQSALNFSWSFSLLGMQQFTKSMMDPGVMAGTLATLACAAERELQGDAKHVYEAGIGIERNFLKVLLGSKAPALSPSKRASNPQTAKTGVKTDSSTGPLEITLSRVSRGAGTVRHTIDKKAFFIVHGWLEDEEGNDDGEFDGVWGAKAFTPEILQSYPPRPAAPFDRPPKPGEALWDPETNPTKSRFLLAKSKGWVEATGPALSRIQIQTDGHTQFWYAVAGFVMGGGVYEGYRGEMTSLGSGYFQSPPQPTEGVSFDLNATHVFKLVPVK